MTEAEKAYRAAQRLIAKAIAENADVLTLNREDCRALETLPPEIAEATTVKRLYLSNTQVADLSPIAGMTGIADLDINNTRVTDLSPIAGMTGITMLDLDNTQVTDLSPIAGMTGIQWLGLDDMQIQDFSHLSALPRLENLFLVNSSFADLSVLPMTATFEDLDLRGSNVVDLRPLLDLSFANAQGHYGLGFGDTPATAADPRLAEIADIDNNGERLETVLAYLRTHANQGALQPPAPDTLAPILEDSEKLEVAASLPSEAERDETLKKALHKRLLPKSEDLARAAGNQFMRLAARARALTLLAEKPFDELDMLLMHLEVEDLKARADAGEEDGLPFTPEVIAALDDVLRLGPGLTLDNPDVELLIVRTQRYLEEKPHDDVAHAHDRWSNAAKDNDAVFGQRLRILEATVSEMPDVPASDATQTSLHRNVILRIVRITLDTATISTLGIGALQFLWAQWPEVFIVVNAYGPLFADWFFNAMASIPNVPPGLAGLPKRKQRNRDSDLD